MANYATLSEAWSIHDDFKNTINYMKKSKNLEPCEIKQEVKENFSPNHCPYCKNHQENFDFQLPELPNNFKDIAISLILSLIIIFLLDILFKICLK